ncbi:hypothetical protein PIB30_090544, partial [Stylosanthes scabra]|nr:hypothetical protein [Stylosanthes scabra]
FGFGARQTRPSVDHVHPYYFLCRKGRTRNFSTEILEQKNSVSWASDKTKKDSSSTMTNLDGMEVEQENEGQAQPLQTYTKNVILEELQNMRHFMEERLQSIEASQARLQDAIDHLCTQLGFPNKSR